jgi:methionine synthase I (cobalamin-dependent)
MDERFGLQILGGCCGTDDRHLRALAARMAAAGHG